MTLFSRKRREMRQLTERALKENGKLYGARQKARDIVAAAHKQARTV